MRELPTIWSHDAEAIAEGLRLAEHAIALDPTYALPKALAAWCYAQGVTYMRTPCPVEDRAKAIKLAQEAASLDSNDPLVLTVLSGAYVLGGHLILQSLVVDTQVAVVEVQPLDSCSSRSILPARSETRRRRAFWDRGLAELDDGADMHLLNYRYQSLAPQKAPLARSRHGWPALIPIPGRDGTSRRLLLSVTGCGEGSLTIFKG